MIGNTISHYKVLEKLGEGGMGVVYKAEDFNLNRFVALKFISPELTQNKNAIEHFIYEAQTASSLDHQNISTIYEIDKSDYDRIFISMAYYNGETLKRKISRGNISIGEAVNIGIQIAEGLTKTHNKSIIHKDIKPANIILSEDQTIKIIDFGLSTLFSSISPAQPQTKMGTISYMSPEIVKSKAVDFQSDIWSLGVVLYEMLTGKVPFEGDYDQEILYAILVEDPISIRKLLPEVPTELERIVLKALEKKQEKRYKHMSSLLKALTNVNNSYYNNNTSRYSASIKEKPIKSIAVLPFINLSGNPEQEYLAEGMADSLITSLSKLLKVKIISRKSTIPYKNSDKTLPEIAEQIHADAIIEGSVLRKADIVQITIQLYHGVANIQLWADKYERRLEDILKLQAELVRTISKEIKSFLIHKESKNLNLHFSRPESYDNYLKGCFHLYKVLPDHFNKALEYFQQALNKDPNFALAYTGIANVWFVRSYWSINSAKKSMPKARKAADKALEIDDTLAEAHDVLARIKFFYDWNWDGAEIEFKKAIELNPSHADSYLFYSAFLRSMKRDQEALIQVNKGLELDPISSFSQGFLVAHMLHLSNFDEAIRKLREMEKTDSDSPFVHRYLWISYHQKQLYNKALEEAKKYFLGIDKLDISDLIALKSSQLSYQKVMELAAVKLENLSIKTYIQPIWIARLYAYANNYKLAIKWLQIAHKKRDPLLVNIAVSHDWTNVRNNKQFKDIMTKMKLI